MKAILIDTNAVAAMFCGDQNILDLLAKAECVYASVIMIGELEAGFRGGSRYAENLALLERFLAKPTVEILAVSRDTSNCFGRIKSALKTKGKPIPVNDVWLAAQCMETGAVLLTYDRHFAAIDGLRVWPEVAPPQS